ncbi:MAG: HAMP domain-containing histidine kinase [Sedimentisphaerales bacterium]|nr:HAMP domain-containing histidine kinase [Sedimentisphaerales bacterium]
MVSDENIQSTSYELPLDEEPLDDFEKNVSGTPLSESLLKRNVLWFCQFRWIVIGVLVSFGFLGLFPGLIDRLGMRPPGAWPFIIAAVLTATNLIFLSLARTETPSITVRFNLWSQITTDLVILTVVIYFVGGLETNIAFAYLFHIVLACVFFSRRHSLIVTIMAIGMFAASSAAEYILGILPPTSIFAGPLCGQDISLQPSVLILNFLLAVGIWLVVWYLASYLSSMVRRRDFQLDETNRRLIAAQEERSRHMLATTHQLKAPFAAIYSNAQLLQQGYCGQLPDEAIPVVQRISSRCRRLTAEIQKMLQLANLSSTSQAALPRSRIVSTDLLLWCISQVEPIAQEKGVTFKADMRPVPMVGTEDHFKMLFINLLANAVIYSHRGGEVHITCRPGPNSEPIVIISDQGIGIPAEKIPRIFEEHYRTKEAMQHNKESSGLGLAIVKQVAQMYKIHIRVESRPDSGTTFELRFPVVEENAGGEIKEK